MKIEKIKINNYGGLKGKEIDLRENINIIYGKNESGKSTILKFIINSLYGISKNKKGKEISDYEKYKPWDEEGEFSGKIKYQLSNGEKYEVYRDFNKKNPEIYNEKGEEISWEYNISKTNGSEFFIEQTQVDEDTFISSFATLQQDVKIELDTQNYLLQKISNLVGTGEENTSYKKIIEKLEKRKLEEIGTERTKDKPLNKIQEEIKQVRTEKEQTEKSNIEVGRIRQEKEEIAEQIQKLEKENNLLKELKQIKEMEQNYVDKNELNRKIIEENETTQKDLERQIEEIEKEKVTKKYSKNKITQCLLLELIINILLIVIVPNKIAKVVLILPIILAIVIYYYLSKKIDKRKRANKKLNSQKEEKISNIRMQIELIEKNNNVIRNEIEKNNGTSKYVINTEKSKVQNKYQINSDELRKIQDVDDINAEIEKNQGKLNLCMVELKNMEFKLENLAYNQSDVELQEKEDVLLSKLDNLMKLNKSIEIAENTIKESYEEMQEKLIPNFTKQLSEKIREVTNGRYVNVKISDTDGIIVELPNGKFEKINKLSMGTIEQIYLSLRLNIMQSITDEELPIFLDEAFAYYDDERLEKVLSYFNNELKSRQIIIFTCNFREKQKLDKMGIEYNFVDIAN